MSEENTNDKDDGSDLQDILKDALEDFKRCVDAEYDNREAALDDLKFARLGEQWSEQAMSKRKAEGRPCMTFNRMPSFIRQVVNDGRQNKPAIKVHPADDKGDTATAAVINGLIRNIEYSSNADIAYDTGLDFAASMGFGFWRVSVEYAYDDTFDKDLMIERISNPFSVYGDPRSTRADSSDWNVAFVVDSISKEEFEQKYAGKKAVDWESDDYKNMSDDWADGENVIIAEYWKRTEEDKVVHKLTDGRVVYDDWMQETVEELDNITNAQMLAQYGITIQASRDVKSHKVCQYIMSGAEILEKNEWAGKYIPIVPVYGEEVNVEGKRHFRSLIRDAKDAQRNFNYWRTTTTELVALAPKAPFIGAVGSFDTDADKWSSANTDTHAYIEYDQVAGASPPQRQPFAGVPAGAMQEALNASDDMKATIGMYDASLGARSNETSGRAINARKAEGDTSTFHFLDNQFRAIRHTGRILIDLIPHVYSDARIVRIIGDDKQPQNVPVNQQLQGDDQSVGEDGNAQIYDLTVGKYDLTVDTGASFQTKREEAAYGMTELVRAYPQAAAIIAPHLAKAQDWPGAEDIAKELEMLSPAAQQANPELQQAQQQLQQLQQQMQQMQQQGGQEIQSLQLQIKSMQADHQIEQQKLQIDQFNAETNRAKVMKELNPAVEEVSEKMSESEKLQFEAALALELEDKKATHAQELELLKQRGSLVASNQNDLLMPDEQLNLVPNSQIVDTLTALTQHMSNLHNTMNAPRVLVRDEMGKPIGSRIAGVE